MVWPDESGDDVEQCRFARAIRANEADHLARADAEGHPVYRNYTTEANRDVVDVEARQWPRLGQIQVDGLWPLMPHAQ